MNKIYTLLFLGLLMFSFQQSYALDNAQPQKEKTQYSYDLDEDYNFDDNSYYVSDEQLKDIEDINKIEDETTLESKIINSSHFTSGTATRTYIPINKNK